MGESVNKCKIKEADRVRRVVTTGSMGTVKEVRFELENSGLSEDARQKARWLEFNGTADRFLTSLPTLSR